MFGLLRGVVDMNETLLILDGFKIGMYVFFACKGMTWLWLLLKNLANG